MSNKLDDRYIEIDLTGAIGEIPVSQGGTGNTAFTTGRVAITEPDGSGGVRLASSSGITTAELNTLDNIATASTIQTRLVNAENHTANAEIHVPATTLAGRYLSSGGIGTPTWIAGQLPPVQPADPTTKFLRGDNQWVVSPLLSSYTGSPQVISTAGALLTWAHGFSTTPSLIQWFLLNGTADAGYSPGDIIAMPGLYSQASGDQPRPSTPVVTTTEIQLRLASSDLFRIANKATGAQNVITAGSWSIYPKAFV